MGVTAVLLHLLLQQHRNTPAAAPHSSPPASQGSCKQLGCSCKLLMYALSYCCLVCAGGGYSLVCRGLWHGTPVAVKRWFNPQLQEEVQEEFRCCSMERGWEGEVVASMGRICSIASALVELF